MAATTGGAFFATASESELSQILESIGSDIGMTTEDRELTDSAALTGMTLLALAGAGSLRWFGRIV